jgi:hypothetical protein
MNKVPLCFPNTISNQIYFTSGLPIGIGEENKPPPAFTSIPEGHM